ncbi:Putative uncharacterized protein FLJ37770 [Eumeta japonica]|uniref:Histone-lysine N-methyltransferase SETMAR n=1 Tax=Eumeta variegata TaxID=151549 RepID=A0A4C1X0G3_EUMVA|nr:Putative uncharacterized protein FLJ37770 [Eumeta japonica]
MWLSRAAVNLVAANGPDPPLKYHTLTEYLYRCEVTVSTVGFQWAQMKRIIGETTEPQKCLGSGRCCEPKQYACPFSVRLRLAFYDETPSLAAVYTWFNEFQRGRANLTDDLRDGRSTVMTEDNISAVRLVMETGRRVTYRQILRRLGIGLSLHDNASPYTARQTTNYLKTLGIEILVHPPYSSEFISCDFIYWKNCEERDLRMSRKQWLHMKRPSKTLQVRVGKMLLTVLP